MEIEITILISIITVALSAYFGLKNNKRSDTKDIEERVKENTRINFKLDNIASTTQEIKTEISSMRNDIKNHNDRLITVEQSVKSAHHRLDTLEQHIEENKKHEQG